MTLAEKLLAIQTALNVPKGQYNSHGGFKYRSCEDILNAVKPLLNENKAVLTIDDEMVLIGERYYSKATVTLSDLDNKDEKIVTHGFAREAAERKGMDASQITGAASSYARKYALNGMFAIDDTKDADATNVVNCADCKKVIEKHDKFSSAQIAAMSKKKYGRALCYDCSVKQRDANKKKAEEKKDAK